MSSLDAQSPLRRNSTKQKGKAPAAIDTTRDIPPPLPQRPVSGGPLFGAGNLSAEPTQEPSRIQYPFSDTDDSGDDAHHGRPSTASRSVTYAPGVASSPDGGAISPESFDADYDSENENDVQMERYEELKKEHPILSGYLKKKGLKRRTWKKRWFVLRPTRLCYYKNDKEYELLAIVNLPDVHAVAEVELKKRLNVFGVVTKQRTYYMQANNEEEMKAWVEGIQEARKKAGGKVGGGAGSGRPRSSSNVDKLRQSSTGSVGLEGSVFGGDLLTPGHKSVRTSQDGLDGGRNSEVGSKRVSLATPSSLAPSIPVDWTDDQSEGGSIATTTESFLTVATTPSMVLAGTNTSSLPRPTPAPKPIPIQSTNASLPRPTSTPLSSSPSHQPTLSTSSQQQQHLFPP
ncbi:hypothetical protein HK097_004410, partial [Rhizophlyctis rosea]